ncbi:META domain-containing protein [Tsukamurella paurometabola]|uniref:META domain n=1 Tax=Tsukamurella paurometabola TaxID=2061 RepID=A0A3P8KSE7_TSUPA|nr:META domain-containing protein [Tsukamurella paurometabola]MBS4103768.1 META domain-containing protein [Tsukamurella paurometabola]UEA82472.1 META domain-containing protein [Tsukamurella paurometabola]VDR39527.1 META domain [Tsukamurella paurometabola]
MIRQSASLALPLLAGAAALTAGCAASAGADPATSTSVAAPASSSPSKPALVGSQWRLKSDPAAWFRVQGSNITGNDSCNSLTGTGSSLATPDRVDFGAGLAATTKYCPDPKGTQTAISEALKGERIWSRNGTELVLTDPDNNRSWTFVLTPAGASSSTPATPSTVPSAAVTSSATASAPASAVASAPAR